MGWEMGIGSLPTSGPPTVILTPVKLLDLDSVMSITNEVSKKCRIVNHSGQSNMLVQPVQLSWANSFNPLSELSSIFLCKGYAGIPGAKGDKVNHS